jgi:hypothetical protein
MYHITAYLDFKGALTVLDVEQINHLASFVKVLGACAFRVSTNEYRNKASNVNYSERYLLGRGNPKNLKKQFPYCHFPYYKPQELAVAPVDITTRQTYCFQ